MSEGQESKFLAIFDKLYSSSGPQKPGYESGHKPISLGAKNKVPMFFHIERFPKQCRWRNVGSYCGSSVTSVI